MGSPQDGAAAAAKPPTPKAAAPTPAAPSPATPPPAMMPYPDWSAYYASGAAPPGAFYPPPGAWPGQPMMPPPYGPGMPFHPMYYAHPGAGYPNGEMPGGAGEEKGRKKKRAGRGKSAEGGKGSSSSEDEDGSESGETGSEGSSATGDESNDPQDVSVGRKRTARNAFPEGEIGHTAMESSHGRARKLPVSAPGRATVPSPATNLNMSMEAWGAPHTGAQFAPNMNIAPLMPGHEGAMMEQRLTKLDEREIRREKRKQSNRESARRSRMRKQQECDELARKVTELTGENSALRDEVERYRVELEQLGAENASLMDFGIIISNKPAYKESLKKKNPDILTEEEHAFLSGDGAVPASEGNGFVGSLAPAET